MATPDQDATVTRESSRVWRPAQVVAGIVGLGFVVMGGVTLIRSGWDGPI